MHVQRWCSAFGIDFRHATRRQRVVFVQRFRRWRAENPPVRVSRARRMRAPTEGRP